jgi:putative tryptophan/tyrosine transport system substrate-binding protein
MHVGALLFTKIVPNTTSSYCGSASSSIRASGQNDRFRFKLLRCRGISMKIRKFMRYSLAVKILAIACLALSGCGEKKTKMYRVGIISEVEAFTAIAEGCKAKMTELGYIEGQNITYDIRIATMDPKQVKQVVGQFVQNKADLIFTFPTEASIAAKQATLGTDIPVVFANSNVEGTNLIENLRQPGRNITGVRFPGADNDVMRLGFLHKFAPKAKRVLVLYDPNYPTTQIVAAALRSAAPTLGITQIMSPV